MLAFRRLFLPGDLNSAPYYAARLRPGRANGHARRLRHAAILIYDSKDSSVLWNTESAMDDRAASSITQGDEATLRGLYKPPMELAVLKQLDRLDAHCRNFIAHSPFAVIGSTRAGRGTDVSPRGDAPGFARVLDDHTIAIPDRPGNNRLDTMSNIVADAEVGLLFFIPGIDETLRVNGTARLTHDPELLAAAAAQGREPRLVILVTVREAFLHCGKALKRARLWQDDYRVERKSFPSLGRMIVEQTKPAAVTVEQAEAYIADNYVTGLY
jgi:hypothetical protein